MNKFLKNGRIFLIIIIISIVIFEAIFHQHGSINKRIAAELQDYNSHFQEVLYSQLIDNSILTFYQVYNNELAFGVLEDGAFGLNVKGGSDTVPLVSDGALTWVATSNPNVELSLIYGAILNPEITQITVISEKSKAATIIDSKGVRFWFLVTGQFDYPGHYFYGLEVTVRPNKKLASLMEMDNKSSFRKMVYRGGGSSGAIPAGQVSSFYVEYQIKEGVDFDQVKANACDGSTLLVLNGLKVIEEIPLVSFAKSN
ncbi:hypothetical protein [Paenibacillus silviterrae]|uniref:hypothetical protein n=1 Tax=Paenibacillus silviterrae TaxID=3242194 RepID=UPI002543D18B|nr:hypothetical protein [Paenibacillus chinjuensis]